eukprot:CAMPEP_0180422044 /NCGR_PEP_ID=MMETSP1036_2-20121128/3472_1 /TAXON_ID=632150 /ORGANISM="Azadinium spinosum, Strain 3D9" /LENGTH=61 /DNA_ID=CAMNT_0022427345 /DNA_START=7 /DNA_END=192 /DNA_ORIENTATION=-
MAVATQLARCSRVIFSRPGISLIVNQQHQAPDTEEEADHINLACALPVHVADQPSHSRVGE